MPDLKIKDTTYTLYDGITVIGRGEDADITIDSSKLSRTHVRFTVDGDNVFIEDLGSKNGTFLNNTKITEKKKISGRDNIRLGDLPCSLLVENAEVLNSATAKTRPVRPVALRPQQQSSDLHLARNLVFAGIVILIFALLWISIGRKNTDSSESAYNAAVAEAETALAIVKPSTDKKMNEIWAHKLEKLRGNLEAIPPENGTLYTKAGDLITGINIVSGEIREKLKTEDPEKDAAEAYEKALNGLKGGFSAEEAIARFKTIVTLYPGTRAAGFAKEKIFELEKNLKSD